MLSTHWPTSLLTNGKHTIVAKAIYKERAATAECVNAQCRNRGLLRFLVRGLEKAKAVGLWHALAHNMVGTGRLLAT